jgi:hypothetical protein
MIMKKNKNNASDLTPSPKSGKSIVTNERTSITKLAKLWIDRRRHNPCTTTRSKVALAMITGIKILDLVFEGIPYIIAEQPPHVTFLSSKAI